LSYNTELDAATKFIETVQRWLQEKIRGPASALTKKEAEQAFRDLNDAKDKIEKGRRAARKSEGKSEK
jgi:hypothetical protein